MDQSIGTIVHDCVTDSYGGANRDHPPLSAAILLAEVEGWEPSEVRPLP